MYLYRFQESLTNMLVNIEFSLEFKYPVMLSTIFLFAHTYTLQVLDFLKRLIFHPKVGFASEYKETVLTIWSQLCSRCKAIVQ